MAAQRVLFPTNIAMLIRSGKQVPTGGWMWMLCRLLCTDEQHRLRQIEAAYRYTTIGMASLWMPYQILCNDVQREGVKPRIELAFRLLCYAPLHNIWYGIRLCIRRKMPGGNKKSDIPFFV